MVTSMILDPQKIDIRTSKSTLESHFPWCRPIPSANARYQCLPNFSDWWPGDILLFSKCVDGKHPDLRLDMVEIVQGAFLLGQPHDDAQWVHAAIYIGNGACIEAVNSQAHSQKGIMINLTSLPHHIQHEMIRVRRVKTTRNGVIWNETLGRNAMMSALNLTSIYHPILWANAVEISKKIMLNTPLNVQKFINFFDIAGAIFSAQLCAHVITLVANFDVFNGNLGKMPYALSQSKRLEDVPVEWREAAP